MSRLSTFIACKLVPY